MDRTSQGAGIRGYPYLRGHLALVMGQIVLAIIVTLRLGGYPDPGFSLNENLEVIQVDKERDLALVPKEGDRIVEVADVEVNTLPEFWHQIRLQDKSDIQLTLETYNETHHLTLQADDLAKGRPPSLREGDSVVGIRCIEDPAYADFPRGIDFEALHQILENHASERGAYVSYNRPFDNKPQAITLKASSPAYFAGGLLLLGAIGMILVLLQAVRSPPPRDEEMASHGFYLSVQILMLSLAGVGLLQGLRIMSDPLLFVAAALGVAFFKATNLEMHLQQRSGWVGLGGPTRLAIYVAPVIFVGQLLLASFSLVMMVAPTSGSDVTPDTVSHLERLWTLLLAVVMLMVVVDAALLILRHQRRGEDHSLLAVSSRIGLGFSMAALLVALYLFVRGGGVEEAGYAVFAAFLCQLLGDLIGILDLPRDYWRSSDPEQLFSREGIRSFLEDTGAALPAGGITYVVTALEHVAVRFSLEPFGPHGEMQLVSGLTPKHWSDLLDVLVTEGGYIPRLGTAPDADQDPVEGMAHKLGIYLVLPLYGALRRTAVRNYLIAAADLETNPDWEPPPPEQLLLPHLQALVGSFEVFEPAVIFQATLAAHQLAGQRLPEAPQVYDASEAVSPPSPGPPAGDEERAVLDARIRALEAEIHRLHPVEDVETTSAQERAVATLAEAQGPVLLVGESGVGKTLLARLASARTQRGPFIRLAAHELPEMVLEFEIFGGESGPGRFQAALGGTLCIETADRLPNELYVRLFEKLAELEPARKPWLVLTRDSDASGELSAVWSPIVEEALVAVVQVPNLRSQSEAIPALAQHFLHRSAMRHGKVITDFSPDALEALIAYGWPGNMRELRDVLESAVLMCNDRELSADVLHLGTSADETKRADALEGEIDRLETRYGKRLQDKDRAIEALEARVNHLEGANVQLSTDNERIDALVRIQPSRAQLEAVKVENQDLRQKFESAQTASIRALELEIERAELLEQLEALKQGEPTTSAAAAPPAPALIGDVVLEGSFEDIEKKALARALEKCGGNKSAAARELGLKRSTFINKLNKHNLG